MTRLVEVKRVHVPLEGPFDFASARAEVVDADARGDQVSIEDRDIVIRTKVFVRGRAA